MINARSLEKKSPLGKPLIFSSKKNSYECSPDLNWTWIISDVYQRVRLTADESVMRGSD